jgi:hypothetical protein
MASYLVWDLHDLLEEGSLRGGDARERLRQFVRMLQAATRATEPVYPSRRTEGSRTGNARAERGRRLATHSRDEELFEMVLAARGDGDAKGAGGWAQRALSVLEGVEAHWERPSDQSKLQFIENEVEPFLRRLGRIDQLDRYRPTSRPGLERR